MVEVKLGKYLRVGQGVLLFRFVIPPSILQLEQVVHKLEILWHAREVIVVLN